MLADRCVKDVIESAPGVGQVWISGAADRAVQINVEAKRLAAYGLSILQVREALVRQNADIPGGRVDAGFRELGLRTLGRFRHPRDFLEMVVATVGDTPVRLRDLGEAVDGTKEVRNLARLDGQPAVVLSVQRQSGENTVEVIQAVKQRLERSRQLLPPDVTRGHHPGPVAVHPGRDARDPEAPDRRQPAGHGRGAAVHAFLAVEVIAAVAIPASIIATFAMMRAMDFTLNNMTMLALVLMVGVVIDDAIVVLENVFHFDRGEGPAAHAGGRRGHAGDRPGRAGDHALAGDRVPAGVVSVEHRRADAVPVRHDGHGGDPGVDAGQLLADADDVLAAAAAGRGGRGPAPASRRGFYHWIEVGYLATLRWSLRYRWVVLLLSLAVIGANVPLYKLVKQDYIPTNVDESEFEVELTAPEGASLRSMDQRRAGDGGRDAADPRRRGCC